MRSADLHSWSVTNIPGTSVFASNFVLVALLFLLIAAPGLPAAFAAEPAFAIARLERVQGDVGLARGGAAVGPVHGASIARRDRITTGANARAAILFPDGSRLLLGANAEAVIEDFLPEDGRQRAAIMLEVPRGPFRLLLTQSQRAPDKQVLVRTAGTILIVKATDVWVGPIDGSTGVLSISGSVQVRNSGGSLVLDRQRQGTYVRSPSLMPEKPAVWSRGKIEEALELVAFH